MSEKWGIYMNEKLKEAKIKLEVALNHFNNAEQDYVETAILNLNSALENYNSLCKELGLPIYKL